MSSQTSCIVCGASEREFEKKKGGESQIRDHLLFPRLSFKVLQTQQGGKATNMDPKLGHGRTSPQHPVCVLVSNTRR